MRALRTSTDIGCMSAEALPRRRSRGANLAALFSAASCTPVASRGCKPLIRLSLPALLQQEIQGWICATREKSKIDRSPSGKR
jgi:hypothetical protein